MSFVATDYYTRLMAEVFDENQLLSVPTAFSGSFFGVPENGGQTVFTDEALLVDIDIIRADGEKLAPTVERGTSTSPNEKVGIGEKFTSFSREFGLIEKESAINSKQLLSREAGMTPYQLQTQLDRARAKAMKLHFDDVRKVIRTAEYFARQSILTGTHPAKLGTANTNFIYDFKRNAANIVTVGTPWSGASDPIAQIDDGCDVIRQNAKVRADGMLVGGDAFESLLKNSNFRSNVNTSAIQYTQVGFENPVPERFNRFIENGFEARGKLRTYKGRTIWLFTTDDIFTDDFTNPASPTVEEWMPLDEAVLFHSGARCDRYFGPKDRLDLTPEDVAMYQYYFGMNPSVGLMPPNLKTAGAFNGSMFHFDAYRGGANKTIVMRTQMAPIYPTTQTDAFYTMKGLV